MADDGYFWVGTVESPETYQLDALLGGGGEGEVWRAILPLSDAGRRPVAVKIMPATGEPDEAASWARFGHLLKSLAHPGLVRVTDVFLGPGPHRRGEPISPQLLRYVVMDYVEGPTLRDWVDENPAATAAGRLALLRTAASALDEMHSGTRTEVPVAHGDVKPANIIVGPTGGTILVDLGLARLTDSQGVSGRSNPYAAPELRSAHAQATPEADAYAFAVTTAQVLTGQIPPTDPAGFLDVPALQTQLQTSSVTQRRPMLVHQLLTVLSAAPGARPRLLRQWLDAAADTLSQVTSPPVPLPPGVPGSEATVLSTSTLPPVVIPPPLPPGPPGPPVPPGTTTPAGQPRGRRRVWIIAAAIAVVLLAAGGVAAALAGGGTTKKGANGPTTVTSQPVVPPTTPLFTEPSTPIDSGVPTDTGVPTNSGVQTDSGVPTDTSLPTNDTAPVTTQWISDLGNVATDPSSDGHEDNGSYQANGQLLAHSVDMYSYCGNGDGGDWWAEYDLARQWSTLTGTIGLEDGSPSNGKMSWRIIAEPEGKVLASGTQTLGTSKRINISVAGRLRLRLLVNDTATISNDCPDPRSTLVWGNLQLRA